MRAALALCAALLLAGCTDFEKLRLEFMTECSKTHPPTECSAAWDVRGR